MAFFLKQMVTVDSDILGVAFGLLHDIPIRDGQ